MSRPDLSSRARRGSHRQAGFQVESLEERALLSTLGLRHPAGTVSAEVSHGHVPTLIPGPIRNLVGPGYAVKSPRFFEQFAGPPLSELSVAGAKARVDAAGTLTLTGIVTASAIPSATEAGTTPLYYIWGIDRGGSPVPGPIPGRPQITFDTLVVVGITEAGINASLVDIASGQTTPLASDSVVLKQNAVQISLPANLIGLAPQTMRTRPRAASTGASVNFFTSTAPPETAGIDSLAAFAPEFRNFPVHFSNSVIVPVATRLRNR